ncbi:MAG: diguanylate cyclase [Acholeplasmataceae bacterium]
MNVENFKTLHKSYMIKIFLIVFIVFLLLYLFFTTLQKYDTYHEEVSNVSDQETIIVDGAIERLRDYMSFVVSDIEYLESQFEISIREGHTYESIENSWAVYSNSKQIYSQIRFLDTTGMEKIRINKNKNGAIIVDDADLTDKSDRYYFTESIGLADNAIYFSNIDLNVEDNLIVHPYELELRLSTPVYVNNILYGVIVLNFDFNLLLDHMPYYNENSNGDLYIVDQNSYFIYSNDVNTLWGFDILEHSDQTLANMYPQAWENIEDNQTQFITDLGLYTVKSLDFTTLINRNNYSFYSSGSMLHVITFVSNDTNPFLINSNLLLSFILLTLETNWLMLLIVLFVSLIFSLLVYNRLKISYEESYYASIDQLTNIYNRNYGISNLEKMMKDKRNISICFIDLNGLKGINDFYGHQTGDQYIKHIIQIIHSYVEFPNFMFRLGGDEFIMVMHQNAKELEETWQTILNSFKEINENQGNNYKLSASHGIVELCDKFDEVNKFITAADHIMYIEKNIYYKNKEVQKLNK